MPGSASTPASRSTSAIPTHPGNAAATRTPMASSGNTSQRAPTCRCTPPNTSPTSPTNSTGDPENDSAGTTRPTASTNYCQPRQKPLLQPNLESTLHFSAWNAISAPARGLDTPLDTPFYARLRPAPLRLGQPRNH